MIRTMAVLPYSVWGGGRYVKASASWLLGYRVPAGSSNHRGAEVFRPVTSVASDPV